MKLTGPQRRFLTHIERQDSKALYREPALARTRVLITLRIRGLIVVDGAADTGRILTDAGRAALAEGRKV